MGRKSKQRQMTAKIAELEGELRDGALTISKLAEMNCNFYRKLVDLARAESSEDAAQIQGELIGNHSVSDLCQGALLMGAWHVRFKAIADGNLKEAEFIDEHFDSMIEEFCEDEWIRAYDAGVKHAQEGGAA